MMASVRKMAPILIASSIYVFVVSMVRAAPPDLSQLYCFCSGESYDLHDPYKSSVSYVLTGIVDQTAYVPNYDYYSSSPWAGITAYGHGNCNSGLSQSDCSDCLTYAFPKIINSCLYRRGGQIQLGSCRLRFEDYPFVE